MLRFVTQVPRPKQEISVPYKHYRLVTADGRALERQDKHPFCMSRVYYAKDERPQEAWAEDSDGSYRWRQSSSEIKLIALKASTFRDQSHLDCKRFGIDCLFFGGWRS